MARKPGRSHKESLYRRLLDPTYAAGYVNAAFEEDGVQGLLGALRNAVKAHGATTVSTATEISRSALHQITSESGNPTATNLISILNSLNLAIQIKPARATCPTGRIAMAAKVSSTTYEAARVIDVRKSNYVAVQPKGAWSNSALTETHA